jgi:hypothetical protein
MSREDILMELWGTLEQLSDEDLQTAKSMVEKLLTGEEEPQPAEAEELQEGGLDPANPTVINLAGEMGVAPDLFLMTLADYPRDLLTTYVESQDPGMLISLRKALGLSAFPMK